MKIYYFITFLIYLSNAFMDCGNAPFCGILTLERGGGKGKYFHEVPLVHGLWPETGSYGSSKCISPQGNPNLPIPKVSCYNDLSFQEHEYRKHGICISTSPTDFFNKVCTLSEKPLNIMIKLKQEGKNLEEMSDILSSFGYEIFNIDKFNDQVELSVCAGQDGIWKFSKVADFNLNCI